MSGDLLTINTQIHALTKKIASRSLAVRIFRTFAPSLIIILSLGAFAPMFESLFQTEQTSPKMGIYSFFVAFICWAIALAMLVRRMLKLQPPSRANVLARTDEILERTGLPPSGVIENKKANGDNSLWELLRSQSDQAKLADIRALPKLEFQDWFFALCIMSTVLLCMVNPSQSGRAISVDFSPVVGDYALEIVAWASSPPYIGGANLDISATKGTIELAKGSVVEVRGFGAKGAPTLKIGNYHSKMGKIGERRYVQRVVIYKSGTLEISRFGSRQKWHIKIKDDKPPKIGRPFRIEKAQNSKIALSFKARDDYKIAKAALVLREKPWFPFVELIGPPLQSIYGFNADLISQDEVSHFEIDVGDSVLSGKSANAFVILEDSAGLRTTSKAIALEIDNPLLETNLAQALQEQRLKLLRTRKHYRSRSGLFGANFDANPDIRVSMGRPAAGAPPEIQAVYNAITAILIAPLQMGLDETGTAGLIYAQTQLAGAKNLESAKLAADILWDLVIRSNQAQPQDTKSRIAEAISKLKQALQSGAGEGEISDLRAELGQAISEHIEALQNQSPEAGDMEVEGHDTTTQASIGQTIDEAQALAKTGDVDAANQKLDELARQLENLSGVEASDGGGAEGQAGKNDGMNATAIDEILRDQRTLADDTQNADDGNAIQGLAARQEELRKKLGQSGQSDDPNLHAAKDAMSEAAQKLRTNHKNEAMGAQNSALSALQNYANSLDSNNPSDPIGRQIPASEEQSKSGPSGGNSDKEKIPTNQEQARSRNIFERLRQRLEKNQKDDEQRRYLEELLRRQ
ncbi:MAG: hypothetical protein FD163_456 [Hyphomonadaceae bacterium]|nr:MAG: hypothetical protein FD128_446 [Hyphomonadaceae bacterium]KAF0187181.1 MAG: hypothetical protein FD163_456 [Hyphomonadaceae bacterium]